MDGLLPWWEVGLMARCSGAPVAEAARRARGAEGGGRAGGPGLGRVVTRLVGVARAVAGAVGLARAVTGLVGMANG
ncbi:hypothetical protein Afil01_54590 [Actinorhabdospora filicis]|uniref:Uncharacterized protein n=1 Tax=Actinorhabdospora filicis TaxID=1785913 RepID=A0A9W6SR34_9ACTN|nr:hypothetical protein Afil01_54590 [Actinorhabdospora filicis]